VIRSEATDRPWNRAALDTYLRYHYEQGLSARRWRVDEIFPTGLHDT
jgi:hypothetical protein